jgi:MoaA/NifB/PqqE/SkfB family radical SAM enzyme
MTDPEIRQQLGNRYYDELCPDKKRFLNKKDVLDFDYLTKWVLRFCPGCELHISGGECLLRPDIETQIQKLVDAGISTTIFTNGMLIRQRPRLAHMPLKWVVAHHMPNPFDKWLANVKLIAHRPIITTRLITNDNEDKNRHEIAKQYDGLNFYWGRGNGTKYGVPRSVNDDDLNCIASGVIHLIVPDGRVFPCNVHSTYAIGHIMHMKYDPDTARAQDAHAKQCILADSCSAYQTARMVYLLEKAGS